MYASAVFVCGVTNNSMWYRWSRDSQMCIVCCIRKSLASDDDNCVSVCRILLAGFVAY